MLRKTILLGLLLATVCRADVALDYRGDDDHDGNQPSYTFPDLNIGGPGKVLVTVHTRAVGVAIAVSSATLDGVAATTITNHTSTGSNTNCTALLEFDVTSAGPTAPLFVQLNGTGLRCGVASWRVTGAESIATTLVAGDDPSAPLTIPAGGAAVASVCTASASSATWSNATERLDTNVEGILHVTAADRESPAGETVTIGCDLAHATLTSPVAIFAVVTPTLGPAPAVVHYYNSQLE